MTRRCVLTEAQVHALRAAYKPGVIGHGYLALARRFGLAESTVRDAVNYRTYALISPKGGSHG